MCKLAITAAAPRPSVHERALRVIHCTASGLATHVVKRGLIPPLYERGAWWTLLTGGIFIADNEQNNSQE